MKFLLKHDNVQLKVSMKSSLLGGDLCFTAVGGKVQKGCHGASLLLIPTLASTWGSRASQQVWTHCMVCWCCQPNVHLLDITWGFSLWAAGVWHQVLKAPVRHSQLTLTRKNTQPLHSLGTGQVGQAEQGIPLEGGLWDAVKALCVSSPGTQSGGMGAGTSTSQALSQQEEQAEKHQISLVRQAQGMSQALNCSVVSSLRHFSHRQRDAGA